jgi:hypothetical protein
VALKDDVEDEPTGSDCGFLLLILATSPINITPAGKGCPFAEVIIRKRQKHPENKGCFRGSKSQPDRRARLLGRF